MVVKTVHLWNAFLSDISIFSGVRSDHNQPDWFLNNGTKITFPLDIFYPTANASLCQQITWPLIYDDGINLLPKRCDEEAYFMCQILCKTCDSNKIHAKIRLT